MAFNFTASLCEMLQGDNGAAVLQVRYNTIVSVLLVWPPSLYCAFVAGGIIALINSTRVCVCVCVYCHKEARST